MTLSFVVRGGKFSGKIDTSCEDGRSVAAEGLAVLADLSKDILPGLLQDEDWQMDVLDDAGKPIFGIRVWALGVERQSGKGPTAPSAPIEKKCDAYNGAGIPPAMKPTKPGLRIYSGTCKKCGGKGRITISPAK